jgi:hypothetical protein
LGETAAREEFTCFLVQSFIGWSAQDASLLVDAKIAVQKMPDGGAWLGQTDPSDFESKGF